MGAFNLKSSAANASFTLFHGWRSSASRRVRLCLAEKGLSYESRLINMIRGDQHQPDYLAMNPNGVVPTLLHGDRVLYESSVIAEYLEDMFPEPAILPSDPFERSKIRNFVRWIDEACLPQLIVFNWSSSMQPVASQWTAEQLAERLARIPTAERREAWTRVARKPYSDDEKAKAMAGLVQLLERMTAMLQQSASGVLIGDLFSLADIAAIPFVMRISELNAEALADHSAVVTWWDAVRARPSFALAKIEAWDLGN
jgi:glutathione S-transferase